MLGRKFCGSVDLVAQIRTRGSALQIVHSFERDGFEKTLEVFLTAGHESSEQDCAVPPQLLIDYMRVDSSPRDEIHATDSRRYDKRQEFTGTQVLALHEPFF